MYQEKISYIPESILDICHVMDCEKMPQGFYTGTPWGNVDIVPIESQDYSRYRLLVAPAYNKAMAEDMDKLDAYVMQGGNLIIGWPQLSVVTDREDMEAYRHQYISHPFVEAIAAEREFTADSFCGKPLAVCDQKVTWPVLIWSDQGRPLVYCVNKGDGCVYFVNAREYAGNEGVSAVYESILASLVPDCLASEGVYGRGNREVQFAAYAQEDGQRHIYFIAADWYNAPEEERRGELVMDKCSYPVSVPFGQLVKVVSDGTTAVWPVFDEHEVLSVNGCEAKVQGIGTAEFMVASKGEMRKISVDFTEETVQTVKVNL